MATEKALEYFQSHKNLVFAAVGVLVLIGLAILGWQLFKERQNDAAALEFTDATALYQAEKYREALTAFEKVQSVPLVALRRLGPSLSSQQPYRVRRTR